MMLAYIETSSQINLELQDLVLVPIRNVLGALETIEKKLDVNKSIISQPRFCHRDVVS